MPLLSSFTRCGHLVCSGAPSRGEVHYRALVNSFKGAYEVSKGSPMEASIYARAMAYARAERSNMRGGNQASNAKAYDLLPLREADYLVAPGPKDTVPQRQARLVAMEYLPRGDVLENVVAGLRALLGSDFIAVRTLAPTEITVYPSDPLTATPVITACRVDGLTPKFLSLVDPVTVTGSPVWVGYGDLDPEGDEIHLAKGEKVMVQGETSGLEELVIVAAVQGSGATRQFQATFTKSHDIGASVTTMDWPYQWSTQRLVYVVINWFKSFDPATRALVNNFMNKVARGVEQWAIVSPIQPGLFTTGPLQMGDNRLLTWLGTAPLWSQSGIDSGGLPFTASP